MISSIEGRTIASIVEREKRTYTAYGLTIHSALPLPELEPGTAGVDVVIRIGEVDELSTEEREDRRTIRVLDEGGGIVLAWNGVGAFLVRHGREIIVDPDPDVEEHVLRLFILGTTLAMLLHQRGEMAVFHASAVTISGQAVAFVGMKGAGKSTMAAALHAQGHTLLADDILAVDMNQAGPMALPGFPHLKLWPDSVASLGQRPETLPRLRPELEKRGYRLKGNFYHSAVPLTHIFVLTQGTEVGIEPLSAGDACLELMPHWYGARFGMELLESLGLFTHFQQCAGLANKVKISTLKRPPALSALPDIARLVASHVKPEYSTQSS